MANSEIIDATKLRSCLDCARKCKKNHWLCINRMSDDFAYFIPKKSRAGHYGKGLIGGTASVPQTLCK